MNKEVEYYKNSKENQYLERKSARKKPSELLKYLIAFANAEGGELVIGIEDEKKENIITGFKTNKAQKIEEFYKIDRELKDTPLKLEFKEIPVINRDGEEDKILIISVDVSLDKVIVAPNDDVFLRRGDETVRLSYEQRKQLTYDKGEKSFEDEIINDATLEDIDIKLIEEYKEHFGIKEKENIEVLKARRFMINNKITKAGILLFGKYPSAFLPQARVRFIRFSGNEMRTGEDYNVIKDVTFENSLPKIIVELREFVKTQLREFQYLDNDGKFKVIPEYPEFAWFEGVVNALTHRNYSIYGDYIRILMYDDRLEIHSPGKLPNIVTIENIREERFSRNPRIARVLTELGWVREMNEGVKRIYSEMESYFLKDPIYSEPGNKVVLKLENSILSRQMRIENRLEDEVENFEILSEEEKILLYYMYNSNEKMTNKKAVELTGRSSSYVRKILKNLKEKEILKWYGSSNKDRNQYYVMNKNREKTE